ncbi:BH0509 family protein [Tepidibacillus sp. LV47]
MSRQERKNMIDFIQKVKKLDKDMLMYMTDKDIEDIYNYVYYYHEIIVE